MKFFSIDLLYPPSSNINDGLPPSSSLTHLTRVYEDEVPLHIFDLGCQPLDIAWPIGVVVVERADVAELLNARHVLQQQVNHVKAQLSSLGQDESVDSGKALGVDPLFHAEWAQALDAHHLHTLEVGPTNVKK